MKINKYTYFFSHKGLYYIYHLLNDSLLSIDKELSHTLSTNQLADIPSEVLQVLKDKNYIVDDNYDEKAIINYANLLNRYQNKTLRLTIIPTLACNFKCWYCYEEHHSSSLSLDGMNAIITFIKKEAQEKNIKHIHLDWFGGEPLLCFNKIIKPLSSSIKNWAEENEITFNNSITTNGSLITSGMAEIMEQIDMRQFQITLDGGKEYHNKTKFSESILNSFDRIIENIHIICKTIENPCVTVRINYTAENIHSISSILDCFDSNVRNYILFNPHIVWQEIGKIKDYNIFLNKFYEKSLKMGYGCEIGSEQLRRKCVTCYTENMEQFVVNYDLQVYKCTARNFDGKLSIGRIENDGTFVPNNYYMHFYATSSPVFDTKCQSCRFLPACMNELSCMQKKIEGIKQNCDPQVVENRIMSHLSKMTNK